MEMGFPFFFPLFTLPFSLAIESRGDAGTEGKGKRKGNKENNALATYDDDNGERNEKL